MAACVSLGAQSSGMVWLRLRGLFWVALELVAVAVAVVGGVQTDPETPPCVWGKPRAKPGATSSPNGSETRGKSLAEIEGCPSTSETRGSFQQASSGESFWIFCVS